MKKKLFKKNFYFIFFCFLFVLFDNNVKAISFVNYDNGYIHYDDNFNIISSGGHYTGRKWISGKEKKSENYAYCASRSDHFGAGSNGYKEVTSWTNANSCKYIVNNATKTDGDCSVILGFIIEEALEQSKAPTSKQGWLDAQGSIWTYLYSFTKDNIFKWNNYPSKLAWNNHPKMKKIFPAAWKKYYEATNNGDTSLTNYSDDVKFTVDVSNGGNKFSYVPSGNSCATNGSYVTNKIKITNNEQKTISITILKKWDNVFICDSNDCIGDKKFELTKGQTREIYLKTDKILGKDAVNNIFLDIKAEYSDSIDTSKKIYDTIIYEPIDSSNRFSSGKQRMAVMKQRTVNGSLVNNHSTTKTITISQIPIKHWSCPSGSNNNGYLKSNKSSNPVNKVCASGTNGTKVTDESKYKVSFQDCTCTTATGNGYSVGIILTETVIFRFGTLDLDLVYPGGGFGLDINNRNGGTPTNYYSELTWSFADTDLNGSPYFIKDEVGKVIVNDIERATLEGVVKRYLEGLINSNSGIKKSGINVSTRDSNDEKNTNRVSTKLKVNYDTNSYSGNTFKFEDKHVDMSPAYFSSNGEVAYEESSDYSINGGNKYYIPLRYNQNLFPYDISSTNLSLTGQFKFYYKAQCGISVNDYKYEYTFRTIDVSDPFPKTNLATSANWAEWWNNNTSHQNRIKNTYNNYPNGYIYAANLADAYSSKILKYNKFYTDWSTIQKNGKNTFVVSENGFTKIAQGGNNGSYCEIGRFDSSCDN